MEKKVLFVSHTSNFVKFNVPYLNWFREEGYQVHYASAGEEPLPQNCCDKEFHLPFNRSPFHYSNIKAYFILKKIIEREQYDIIQCHTPVGVAVARMAARKARKQGTKVIYTAHGFHFYQGAPKKNWILFYPVEKFLSKYTDCLITLNEEDYKLAGAKKFKAKEIYKIDGVGVNLASFFPLSTLEREKLREKNNIKPDDFVMIYVAEFIPRKNHELLLRVLPALKSEIPNLKLLLAGTGKEFENCKNLADKLGISDFVEFLGYCRNISELCNISDLMVSTSRQEGLPIGVIESMACGLPIVCTAIRGQVDVIHENVNGLLFPIENAAELKEKILELYRNPVKRAEMRENNLQAVKLYSLKNALNRMASIYRNYMER